MTDVQSQVTSNPSSIAQWAAVEALPGTQDEVAKMAASSTGGAGSSSRGSTRSPACRCIMPKGAFYAFANVVGPLRADLAPA